MMTKPNDVRDTHSTNEETLWEAVLTKDAGFDGAFFYGVRSTGIYCRPTCPSRRPLRGQVVFFRQRHEAEQAGFRPCRRCRPREAAMQDPQVEFVQRACRLIEANAEEPMTLEILSAEVGVSPYHLQRTFKRIMGVTPRQYAEAHRANKLKTQLRKGETVTTALYEAGYGSSSRLYEKAPTQLGMTPMAYRRGGAGNEIGYTIVDCPLGRLLVAATERGICAVSLGDSDEALQAALSKEYSQADIHHNESGLQDWVNAIVRYLEGQEPHLDLPLDVQATAFQWRVWETLRAIPYGSTRSYSEVAQAIGQPTAMRAVARACATNPAALVIPCHRVIREDKTLGGYRWGLERKLKLLAQERQSR